MALYKEVFSLLESLVNSLMIVDTAFTNKSIQIELYINNEKIEDYTNIKNKDKQFLVNGYKNEFSQVIINILNNARDAIKDKDFDDLDNKGRIKIGIFEEEDNVNIRIKDDGGGISIGHLNRIFEPYFTTKDESKGTGIGLYMSKTIIEKNMKGKLSASNHENGATFEISIKKSRD